MGRFEDDRHRPQPIARVEEKRGLASISRGWFAGHFSLACGSNDFQPGNMSGSKFKAWKFTTQLPIVALKEGQLRRAIGKDFGVASQKVGRARLLSLDTVFLAFSHSIIKK
ncbi:MAG: hypothetical protein J7647_25395 [Cyanobacteria bacterium SBLK]|nr:hypothetical protein [Cyanobacteria bacterium SBLK]